MSHKRSSIDNQPSFELESVKEFSVNDSTDEILAYFKKYQVALIKRSHTGDSMGLSQIKELHSKASEMIDQTFSVEALKGQRGWSSHKSADLFGGDDCPGGEWYASFIAQTSTATNSKHAVTSFQKNLPLKKLPFLEKSSDCKTRYTKPVWVFIGRNANANENILLKGRPEHIDSVNHDGTWHLQCSGTKWWYIRPAETAEWGEAVLQMKAANKKQKGAAVAEFADGLPRLKIVVEEGDILVLNTRVWWHQTRIPPTGKQGFSVSYAIDFYCSEVRLPGKQGKAKTDKADKLALPDGSISAEDDGDDEQEEEEGEQYTNRDGMYASKPLQAGEVVFYEAELPDCALPRSTEPNCEIAWLEDGSGALVALQDLQVGDWLTVAPSDSEDSDDEDADSEDSDDGDADSGDEEGCCVDEEDSGSGDADSSSEEEEA